jgi:hypothetical protein
MFGAAAASRSATSKAAQHLDVPSVAFRSLAKPVAKLRRLLRIAARGHIDQHQSSRQQLGIACQRCRRDPSAECRGDNHRPRTQLGQDRAQILDHRIEAVGTFARPFTGAMSAQVECDDPPSGPDQRGGDFVPHRAGLSGTMDQQDGGIVVVSRHFGSQPDPAKALEV